ncbi:MAG: hypothetical protein O3A18_11570 [Planctomycetota bacterium]|jgi:hypothetical protein|nr:hypothetical protein [Planctomycetota bacterium]
MSTAWSLGARSSRNSRANCTSLGRDQTTLEDVVHEGLLRVLEDHRTRWQPFRLWSIEPVGDGFQPEFSDGDFSRFPSLRARNPCA